MTREEYDRLRKQIDRRHQEDLAALDRLWRRLQQKPLKPTRRATLDVTRRAVSLMREAFDVNSVLEKIRELRPDARVTSAAVSVTLQRLATKPDPDAYDGGCRLELVIAGGPRRAARYRVRREPITEDALVEARL